MERRVVVFGGTGFIGRAYAWRCAAHGLSISNSRSPRARRSRGASLRPAAGVTWCECRRARRPAPEPRDGRCRGRGQSGRHPARAATADFQRAHIDLPRASARIARVHGVAHVVHVSALGAATDAPSITCAARRRAKPRCSAAACRSACCGPSVVFGAEDQSAQPVRAACRPCCRVVPLAGAHARMQPVWVRDVAQALWTCVERGAAAAGVYEAVGPQVLTLRELVRCAGRLSGHARPVWPLPRALGMAQAWLLEHLPGPTLMSRDNLRSLQVDAWPAVACQTLQALGHHSRRRSSRPGPRSAAESALMGELQRWRAAHRDALRRAASERRCR